MRELVESIRQRERSMALNEARVDHTTEGKNISSIATMLITTFKAVKKHDIEIPVARARVEAIMQQYLKTMKDETWDRLRDEFVNGDEASSEFAKYLKRDWQTVPNFKSLVQIQKIAKEWVMEINRGGFEFALMMGTKPGMRRLKPADETIALYDAAVRAGTGLVSNGPSAGAQPAPPSKQDIEKDVKELFAAHAEQVARNLTATISIAGIDTYLKQKLPNDMAYLVQGADNRSEFLSLQQRALEAATAAAQAAMEEVLKSKKW